MNERKVGYLTLRGDSSTAYVSETEPHIGTDKHTDEPVEVVWDGQRWIEITSSARGGAQ